jgi:hypothetical protein
MEPLMDFSLQLSEKDIAGLYEGASTRWRKRCLLPGVFVSIAGICALVVQPDWPGIAFLAMTVGGLLIYCGTFMVGAFRRAGIRRFRLTPTASAKTHYQVFEDHITMTSELGHSELRWQAFLTAEETKDYIRLSSNQ